MNSHRLLPAFHLIPLLSRPLLLQCPSLARTFQFGTVTMIENSLHCLYRALGYRDEQERSFALWEPGVK